VTTGRFCCERTIRCVACEPAGGENREHACEKNGHQDRHDFFAFLARMQYINRWGLMRNTQAENIKEHSLDVAMLAHALVVIRNSFFNGALDPGQAALYGIFHDASEIFTGDMPTPVKHFNPNFKRSFHQLEDRARRKLLAMLPAELAQVYEPLFFLKSRMRSTSRLSRRPTGSRP